MFWCPGPTGVGFGVPFFVSGLYKFMGKLADTPGVGFGAPFFVSGLYEFMGKLGDKYLLVSRAHGGWVWGAVLCVWPS